MNDVGDARRAPVPVCVPPCRPSHSHGVQHRGIHGTRSRDRGRHHRRRHRGGALHRRHRCGRRSDHSRRGALGGDRTIDADGALVTPGWVDVHTHYDGQVTWDDELDPSFGNGVTTLVMGNCGVGFAPCPVGEQDTLIELMEGVEDIPGSALHEGVPWGAWSTFPEYLDFLDARSYTLDVAAQLAHGSLRFSVMGERGVDNEDATAEDIAAMRALVGRSHRCGCSGLLDVPHDLPPIDRWRGSPGDLRDCGRTRRTHRRDGRRRRGSVRGDHVVVARAHGRRSVASGSARTTSSNSLPTSREAPDRTSRSRPSNTSTTRRRGGRCSSSQSAMNADRRPAVPAGGVAAGRDSRRPRRIPPLHAETVVSRVRRVPGRGAGRTHA